MNAEQSQNDDANAYFCILKHHCNSSKFVVDFYIHFFNFLFVGL